MTLDSPLSERSIRDIATGEDKASVEVRATAGTISGFLPRPHLKQAAFRSALFCHVNLGPADVWPPARSPSLLRAAPLTAHTCLHVTVDSRWTDLRAPGLG